MVARRFKPATYIRRGPEPIRKTHGAKHALLLNKGHRMVDDAMTPQCECSEVCRYSHASLRDFTEEASQRKLQQISRKVEPAEGS